MSYLDDYKTWMSLQNGTIKNSLRNATIQNNNSSFADSPNHRIAYLKGQPIDIRLYDEKIANNHSRFTNDYQSFLFRPETDFPIGSYLEVDNRKFLIVDFNKHDLFPKAIGYRINHTLKWQDECNLFEYPSVVSNRSSYKDDTWTDKSMVLAQGQYNVYVPKNEETENLKIDQRFFLDGDVYKISYIDGITIESIFTITANKDEYNSATDRIDLQIADYVNCDAEINIKSRRVNFYIGDTFQINAELYVGGQLSSEQLTYESLDNFIATVDDNGLVTFIHDGQVDIVVSYGAINKVKSFNVDVLAPSYNINIIGDNELKKHQSLSLIGEVLNINTVTGDIVNWNLSNTNLYIDNHNGNEIILKANRVGKCIVTASWNGYEKDLEITIKSSW